MMENIGKIFFPDDIILATYSHTSLGDFCAFFMGVVCMGDIILPHGGFRHLVVYKKSDVIYQGTVVLERGQRQRHRGCVLQGDAGQTGVGH